MEKHSHRSGNVICCFWQQSMANCLSASFSNSFSNWSNQQRRTVDVSEENGWSSDNHHWCFWLSNELIRTIRRRTSFPSRKFRRKKKRDEWKSWHSRLFPRSLILKRGICWRSSTIKLLNNFLFLDEMIAFSLDVLVWSSYEKSPRRRSKGISSPFQRDFPSSNCNSLLTIINDSFFTRRFECIVHSPPLLMEDKNNDKQRGNVSLIHLDKCDAAR